ncbi:hypothetical protein [Angustibacter peucedani]
MTGVERERRRRVARARLVETLALRRATGQRAVVAPGRPAPGGARAPLAGQDGRHDHA